MNDGLTVKIDGNDYVITIPAGEYETSHELFQSELIDVINMELGNVGAPFTARLGGIHDDAPRTALVFEHNEAAVHTFDSITGSAVDTLIGTIYQNDDYPQPETPTPSEPTPSEPTPATPTP